MRGRKVDELKREEIRMLRSQGHSLDEISKAVEVSRTTILRYIQNVEILPEFLSNWAGKRGGSRKRKLLLEKSAFEDGKIFVGQPSDRERILFLCALYWAEGSKSDFGLSNTDPELIRLYVNGLREVFGVSDERLRISVRIYEDLDRDKCLTYWSKIVNIPIEKFVSVNVLPGKKKGKLEYGMCRVRVTKGGELLKKFKGINKAMVYSLSP